jgi:hypothetical protein
VGLASFRDQWLREDFGIVIANPALAAKLLPTFLFAVFMTYSMGIVWNDTHRVKRIVKPPPANHANELDIVPALESRMRPTPVKMKGVYLVLLLNPCKAPKRSRWTF